MVAGLSRLRDRGGALRVQARKQHRALDLCARDVRTIGNPLQPCAVDIERSMAVGRFDSCTHQSKRSHDAPHRPSRERRVANESAGERLSREDPRQHAHRGPGVARIKGVRSRTKRPQILVPAEVMVSSACLRISTPSARRQSSVERQSAPGAKFSSREGPSASDARMA